MPEHADLFSKAALVARNPDGFEDLAGLDETERSALAYERDHKWHGPTMLWYSIALCAIGAATQGWDQTGSNGANLSFPTVSDIECNRTEVARCEAASHMQEPKLSRQQLPPPVSRSATILATCQENSADVFSGVWHCRQRSR